MTERAAVAVRVVCGLGNPGARYRDTRHNVGFRVVEALARRCGVRLGGDLCRAVTAEHLETAAAGDARPIRLVLAAPQTFMNRSGYSARCLTERLGVPPEGLLVVYDDVHLPLGRIRLRRKGSPGGHRGIESVLESLGTDGVPRLRLGVGTADAAVPGEGLVEFVLAPFEAAEEEAVAEMIDRAADACLLWAREGDDAAMRAFNG